MATLSTPGGVNLEAGSPVLVTYRYNAPGTFECMFIAERKYRVHRITNRVDVVGSDGGGVTAVVQKTPDAKAYNDASIKALHTSSFNLKATVDIRVKGTLSATSTDLQLAVGDAIHLVPTGVTTAAKGQFVIELIPEGN